MMLIGLSGLSRSGKSSCAEYLVKKHGFIEYSFSNPIKNALCSMLNINLKQLEEYKITNDIIPETKTTMRFLLQTFGTEWGRNIVNSDIWVNICETFLKNNSNKKIVISDVRFLNEVDLIYKFNGKLIAISRDNIYNNHHDHESEIYFSTILTLANYHIENNLELKDLYNNLSAKIDL